MSKLGVITNPTSGSGRGTKYGQETLTELVSRGHQVRDLSRGSWAASYEAAQKHRKDLDALIVVGGDGMVHLGLQICAEKKLPLGIVAAGSGNDLAKTLSLPEYDVAAAVDRVEAGLAGEIATIDLGKVQGHAVEFPSPRYFCAVLSGGVDAAVAARARTMKYPRGPVKYKAATLLELQRYKPYGAVVTVDGKRWDQPFTMIGVANAKIFGGGLKISPTSSVTDGLLDFIVVDPLRRRDIIRLVGRLPEGTHVSDPRFRTIPCKEVIIEPGSYGAPMPPAFADGELVGAAPIKISVAKGALRVLGGHAE